MEHQRNLSTYTLDGQKVNKTKYLDESGRKLSSGAPSDLAETSAVASRDTEADPIQRFENEGGRAHFPVVARIGNDWVTWVQDGVVALGTEAEAWQFASKRDAWAHMGRESLPATLMRLVRLVHEDRSASTIVAIRTSDT